MKVNIMPSMSMIVAQIVTIIVIIAIIYLYFLLVKTLKIYIKKNS